MSTAQGSFGGTNGAREFGPGEFAGWRARSYGASRWTAFELVAMILGFIVFWPIGLAILAYKFWQRKSGGEDLQTFAAGKWREARSAMAGCGPSTGAGRFHAGSSGNAAFDEWKTAELARLEEEWRKLQAAHREFAEYLDNVRKAKDREEFDRFMNARRNPPQG
jgi:Protein of unknown function (DUF2852)